MTSTTSSELSALTKQELIDKVCHLTKQVHHLTNRSESRQQRKLRPLDFQRFRRRHVFLRFLYLGWQYSGLCRQQHSVLPTIEGEVIRALCEARLMHPDWASAGRWHFCGRTDKGVSAFSQVLSIMVRSYQLADNADTPSADVSHTDADAGGADADGVRVSTDGAEVGADGADSEETYQLADLLPRDELDYPRILNKVLPEDIRVLAWAPVSSEHSARFNCRRRVYRYFFPRRDLNLQLMRDAANRLVGEHDFRNLCKLSLRNGIANYRRRVESVSVTTVDETRDCDVTGPADDDVMCQMTICGYAYLYHQIRCIMAVLLLVGQGLEHPSVIDDLLDVENNPRKPYYTMASEVPLVLYSAEYDDSVQWYNSVGSDQYMVDHLHKLWTEQACRTSVVRCMLDSISSECNAVPKLYPQPLVRGYHKHHYVPLMKRKVAESLEERVIGMAKRGKLPENTPPLFEQIVRSHAETSDDESSKLVQCQNGQTDGVSFVCEKMEVS